MLSAVKALCVCESVCVCVCLCVCGNVGVCEGTHFSFCLPLHNVACSKNFVWACDCMCVCVCMCLCPQKPFLCVGVHYRVCVCMYVALLVCVYAHISLSVYHYTLLFTVKALLVYACAWLFMRRYVGM